MIGELETQETLMTEAASTTGRDERGDETARDARGDETARDARGDETARDARGRFQPGQSGNPAGKAPGTLNHATRFRLSLEAGDFQAASRLIVQKMREGNFAAARFIVDHVDPK